ncbi:MAG TPA: TetR/AcrR family transcriptional regulator [Kineosporiaceae bacterium]|nr:TetR/AcrR family transcriptional regulator [Kineosporiaceae bacterium]
MSNLLLMQVNHEGRSPAAVARRGQIIASAISVIAELGYAQASFSQIAKRAGISSTRLISYHFDDKNELMSAVAEAVLTHAGEYMRPRISAATGHQAVLAAYIEANLAFIREHLEEVRAVMEIAAGARAGETSLDSSATGGGDQAVRLLAQELRAGQVDGDFRRFDPLVMAVTIRVAIDAAANRATAEPDLNLDAYADELVALFHHATRQEQS